MITDFPASHCAGAREYTDIGEMSRVFAYSPEDRCSIPGRVKPKTQKWYFMQHYKERIKGKVEQSRERSSALPNTSV